MFVSSWQDVDARQYSNTSILCLFHPGRMLMRGSVRLAVKAKAWVPTQKEWSLAAQCVQPEEKERIGRFVFKKDAKSAMVST